MTMPRETLATRLRLGPMSVREATQICRGLLAAIEQQPHGAITSSSIVLEEGRPLLASSRSSSPDAAAFQRALWVPRPADPIWPALIVIVLAAVIITAIAFCKPLGLCWERQPPAAAETR